MKDCLLSIVTVSKDCVSTIDKTLASVQAVKQGGIEYIVVDGVSTDGTLDVVRRYEGVVDCLVSEADTGIYNAMNKGVSLAHGEYVLFINGDDELVASGFPPIMEAMGRRDADIICAASFVCEGEIPLSTFVAQPFKLMFFNSIPHPSSFVKTSLLRAMPFREDLRIASDYDFFLRAYLSGRSFMRVPEVTALHRLGGISSDTRRAFGEVQRVKRARLGWCFYVLEPLYRLYSFSRRLRRFAFP